MLEKRSVTRVETEVPDVDEGWWASVLADEDAYSNSRQKLHTAKQTDATGLVEMNVDWEKAKELYENDEVVKLEVYGFNRGGVLVRGEDVQGFVPVSHLVDMPCGAETDLRREVLNHYIGKTLRLKVIECEPSQERVVLSERAALAGEGRRRELFNTLKTGEIVHGNVTNVTDFGVFVDLGGLEGLIHVSELSWGRVQHPSEVLNIGEPVRALVLVVSEENGRVALSLKRLCPNPWEVLLESYHPGDVVEGTISAIRRYGAFARLKEGVEGLIHISTFHLLPEQHDLDGMIEIGQKVQVKILHIDAERRRLGLGLINMIE
jgi:small subunit ribosomal protein S1